MSFRHGEGLKAGSGEASVMIEKFAGLRHVS